MKRKKFIKNSLISAGGLAMLPSTLNTSVLFNDFTFRLLNENLQIRHGYFSPENCINFIQSENIKSIKIDRFLCENNDLVHFLLNTDSTHAAIGIDNEGLVIADNYGISQLRIRTQNFLLWSEGKIKFLNYNTLSELTLLNGNISSCLLIKGLVNHKSINITAPAFIETPQFVLSEFCGDQLTALFFTS